MDATSCTTRIVSVGIEKTAVSPETPRKGCVTILVSSKDEVTQAQRLFDEVLKRIPAADRATLARFCRIEVFDRLTDESFTIANPDAFTCSDGDVNQFSVDLDYQRPSESSMSALIAYTIGHAYRVAHGIKDWPNRQEQIRVLCAQARAWSFDPDLITDSAD